MRTSLSRTLLSTVMTVALASSVGVPSALSRVHASGPSLLINEINWAGSTLSATDQWVELYNAGVSDIVLSPSQSYHLMVNGVDQADLTSGTIKAGGYYLISRLDPANSLSSLQVQPDMADVATLSLPLTDASYQLTDQAGMVVDKADDGMGMPLAGSIATATTPVASMIRVNDMVDGSTAGAWMSSHTVGQGLKPSVATSGAAAQYATPQNSSSTAANALYPSAEVAPITGLSITPGSSALSTSAPQVTGTVMAAAGQTPGSVATISYGLVGSATVNTIDVSVNPNDSTFFTTLPSLPTGAYRIWASVKDLFGNRGAGTSVATPGSPQGVYTVNQSVDTVAAPVLNAYPAITRETQVTLTGMVTGGTSLVISINGVNMASQALASGQTAFSLPTPLVANSVNKIEVRAVSAAGNTSAPVIATITQNSRGPVFQASLVHLASNPVGASDAVSGMAGAIAPGATVTAYADQAGTMAIGSVTAAADGSFASIDLGDNQYTMVYLSASDQTGPGPILILSNPWGFRVSSSVDFSFSNIGTDRATLTIKPVVDAVDYRLMYKQVGGTYSAPIDLCVSPSSCDLVRTITSLSAGTEYVFAIAAVDQNGAQSTFAEKSLSTLNATLTSTSAGTTKDSASAAASAATSAANGIGGSSSTAPLTTETAPSTSGHSSAAPSGGSTAATPTPAPANSSVTPSPAPQATDEGGEVKSADSAASKNYTPWIILAILLALAILATTGYFYWFGGEAGEAVDAKEVAPAPEVPAAKPTSSTPAPPAAKEDPAAKKADRDKRW